MANPTPEINKEDKPPIFKTWKDMYLSVMAIHAVIILLFYLMMRFYS